MARSKRVADLFELVNVASISEQESWRDERKEQELRRNNSSYFTPYGLALAIKGQARMCRSFAQAVEEAQRTSFDHPALFPWPAQFNVRAYVTEALKMIRYTTAPGASANSVFMLFLALPAAFGRI
ncbi:unnamed protein product [Nippostrongylus brasiliensis]|uniref:AbiV family abortive infection protein n=1 Tax=Nippostrongylus brasiliensis TaxID=27835 RepID=A0A0N4YLA3_NIPBR|nr:unnamed protein product [Nippostrongylus brasiliensis]